MKKVLFKTFLWGALCTGFLFSCTHPKENRLKTTNKDSVDSIQLLTQKIIASDSTDYRLFLKRAKLYLAHNRVDPCLRDIEKALSLNRKDPEIFYQLSDTYFVLGKIKESEDALKKSIALNPKREKSYLKFARLKLILKAYPSATKLANKALSLNPDDAHAFFLKAMVNIEQGDTSHSIQNLRIAINLDTNYYEAMMQLGTILSLRNKQSASNWFKKALQEKSGNRAALYGLAMAYQNSGSFDSALRIYDTILKKDSTEPQIYFNKGYIYLVEKLDYAHAKKEFEKALTLDSTSVKSIYNLGRTYEAEKQMKKAKYYYHKALKVVPNYPLAIAGLNRIEH